MVNAVKVLHVIGGGEFGGAEQHILSLMNQYTNHAIDATVVTFYDSIFAQKLRDAGHSVITIDEYGRFDLRLLSALIRILHTLRPDIVHTHGVRANFFARLAVKKTQIGKVVTTVHSILRHDYPKNIPYYIANAMERYTQSTTKHFIAVSNSIHESLRKAGIADEKITIIQNGIDATKYAPTAETLQRAQKLREEWNIAKDAIVVGTSARLVPVKGLNYLIEGFAHALQQNKRLHLLIAGDGPERQQLEQLVHKHQIDQHVSMLGFRNDIIDCLAVMDIYINCSLSEGTPISVMEAMAAEKPLILTEVGGMKQMALHGVSAWMIPPASSDAIASSILQLAEDAKLRESIAQQAKQTVEQRYTVQAMALKQMQIYYDVLKGN